MTTDAFAETGNTLAAARESYPETKMTSGTIHHRGSELLVSKRYLGERSHGLKIELVENPDLDQPTSSAGARRSSP